MESYALTFNLKDAWEVWLVDVPDGTTIDDIKAGDVEIEYQQLLDSGCEAMEIAQVEAV